MLSQILRGPKRSEFGTARFASILQIILMSLAFVTPSVVALRGQEISALTTGERIRITVALDPSVQARAAMERGVAVRTIPIEATLVELSPDSIAFQPMLTDQVNFVAIEALTQLEKRRSRTRGEGALRALPWGGVVGGGFFLAAGCTWGCSGGEAVSFAAVGAGIGIGIGALIGMALPGERWIEVPIEKL